MGIISFPKANAQFLHTDTDDTNGISVLHALTCRFFHVRHDGEMLLIKLHPGDMIAFKSSICHKGAANKSGSPSVALHVPVNFKINNFTIRCKE